MMDKPNLVILTTYFGKDSSGGSRATEEIFSRIQDYFATISILTRQLGENRIKAKRVIRYRNWLHLAWLLFRSDNQSTIFFGDFYNAFLLALLRKPFYFAYHDNWPELQGMNLSSRFKSFFFNPIYRFIIRRAIKVFTVSDFKRRYVQQYTPNVTVINNGFQPVQPGAQSHVPILMVGNVESRKYGMAPTVFEELSAGGTPPEIHIYGRVINAKLAKKLSSYPFVQLKGFVDRVPYANYELLVHTSFTESFGIVFLEALFSGLKIVTYNTGGASELLKDTEDFLVPAYNHKLFADRIRQLIYHKKQYKVNVDFEAFNWDKASQSYLNELVA